MDWAKGVAVSALDTHRKITPEHQARLDGLADALTDTVRQRLLSDPAFVDRIMDALREQAHLAAMRVREAKLADLRAWEDLHGLPRSIPAKVERRDHADIRPSGGHSKGRERVAP